MVYYGQELYHHGVIGQKWGVRRYQNYDGTWKNAGKERRSVSETAKSVGSTVKSVAKTGKDKVVGGVKAVKSKYDNLTDEQKATVKKVAIGVGVAALTVGAVALYAKNPAARNLVNSMASKTVGAIKPKAKAGKDYLVKEAKNSLKDAKLAKKAIGDIPANLRKGAIEGIKSAPAKVAKSAAEGATIIATTKMLDSMIGTENTNKYLSAYNSYNKKSKINLNASRGIGSKSNEDD